MNHSHFGDSYDLVKRFFCTEMVSLGYDVIIDPLFTGDWHGAESDFYRLVNASPAADAQASKKPRALFLDPDIGVNLSGGKKHVSFSRIAKEAQNFQLVFSFDQSFSRRYSPETKMREKLIEIDSLGCHAIYYNSHARFLFASTVEKALVELRTHLLLSGVPNSRIIDKGA